MLPAGSGALVSMLSTPTTPVGIRSGAESSETVARETSTKSGSSLTSSTSCGDDVRTARPITPSSSGSPSGIMAYPRTPTDHSRPCSSTKAATPGPPSSSCSARSDLSKTSAALSADRAAATAAAHARSKRGRSIAPASASWVDRGSIPGRSAFRRAFLNRGNPRYSLLFREQRALGRPQRVESRGQMRPGIPLGLECCDGGVDFLESGLLLVGDAAQLLGAGRMRGEVAAKRLSRPAEVEQEDRRCTSTPTRVRDRGLRDVELLVLRAERRVVAGRGRRRGFSAAPITPAPRCQGCANERQRGDGEG